MRPQRREGGGREPVIVHLHADGEPVPAALLQEPGEPKNPDESTVFQVWAAFATPGQREEMRREFANGIAWGEAKRRLFELVNAELREPRERYEALMAQPSLIEKLLREGAERARAFSRPFMQELRAAVGLRPVDA